MIYHWLRADNKRLCYIREPIVCVIWSPINTLIVDIFRCILNIPEGWYHSIRNSVRRKNWGRKTLRIINRVKQREIQSYSDTTYCIRDQLSDGGLLDHKILSVKSKSCLCLPGAFFFFKKNTLPEYPETHYELIMAGKNPWPSSFINEEVAFLWTNMFIYRSTVSEALKHCQTLTPTWENYKYHAEV